MNARRQTVCFVAIGATFILFAAWIHMRPRIEQQKGKIGNELVPLGPTIAWVYGPKGPSSWGFSIHQYDTGSYPDDTSIFYLDDAALESVYDTGGGPLGFPVIPRPGGSRHTVTSLMVGNEKFSVPFGVDQALAMVGCSILIFPWAWRWFGTRKRSKYPARPRMGDDDTDSGRA